MNFSIESRLPGNNNKPLTAYKFPDDVTPNLGIPVTIVGTVGAEVGEPYALSFTNYTSAMIEVRFSIDGIDVLTGKPADLTTSGTRMVIRAHGSTKLEAWPESNAGGGRFVFAPDGMAVADHRQAGSPKGILSTAVFVENAPPPPPVLRSSNITRGFGGSESLSPQSFSYGGATRGGAMKGVGTGVGDYIEQEMRTVQGLREPRLSGIFLIKVVSWEELRARLAPRPAPFAPADLSAFGFPGEKAFVGPDLSGIPRMPSVHVPSRLG